jgi:hypothetical protein
MSVMFTLAQTQFRFYADGTETAAAALAAQNTNHTITVNSNAACQLRVMVDETGGVAGGSTDDYQLQVSKNAGAYADVTSSSADVRGYDSASLTAGGATTSRLTGGTGTFGAGDVAEDGLCTDRAVPSSGYMEILYSLEVVAADVADADTLDFRVLRNGATVTYSVTPRLTVSKASPPSFTSAANASVAENATLAKSITVNISSTFALSGVDAAKFELSSAGPATSTTLRWVGNGTKDFEAPDDTGANNVYNVTVEATANSLTTSQANAITVTNAGPAITSSSSVSVAENATLAHALTNVGGAATWSIVGGADAADFEVSGNTLRWASNGTKNFEAPDDTGANNIYEVQVQADVSGETATQTVSATVTNVSQPAATAWPAAGGTTAWKTPSAISQSNLGLGSHPDWKDEAGGTISVTDIQADDATHLEVAQTGTAIASEKLTITDFGLTSTDVPSGATIIGVEVRITGESFGLGTAQAVAQLYDAGAVGGTKANFWPGLPDALVLGGAADDWSAGLTQADVIASTFGVVLWADRAFPLDGDATAELDMLELRVHYSTGGGGDPSVASDAADATHVGDTNKSYHASNFAIVGGTNSGEFELYDNAGTLAVRTNAMPLTAGTSTVQIRDTTNGPAGSEEARTDVLSITVTGGGGGGSMPPASFAYVVG